MLLITLAFLAVSALADVIQLDYGNFYDVVGKERYDYIVKFYTLGCERCEGFAPIFEDIAQNNPIPQTLRFAAVYGDENHSLIPPGMTKYPGVAIYPRNGAAPIVIPVARLTKANVIAFITRTLIDKRIRYMPEPDMSPERSDLDEGGATKTSLGSSVRELTTKSFNNVIMGGTPVLVKFWRPNCSYCSDLAPIYERIASQTDPSRLIIAGFNSSQDLALCRAYGVTSLPTLIFFTGKAVNGHPKYVVMDGRHTRSSIEAFISQQLGSSPRKVSEGRRNRKGTSSASVLSTRNNKSELKAMLKRIVRIH